MEHSKLQEVTWTHNMKSDLQILYDETMDERYDPDGCTVNVKSSLHLKWEEAGYGHYGLTPQDLLDQSFKVKYQDLVTNFDKEFPLKIEGLHKVLEELEKGNNILMSDVVQFIKELDGKVRQKKGSSKEIEREIREALEIHDDVTELNMVQTMELLSHQIPIDTEQELILAFQIFDEENTGYIKLTDLETIMSSHGTPLNDNDLKTLKKSIGMFEKIGHGSECPEIDYQAFIKYYLNKINTRDQRFKEK